MGGLPALDKFPRFTCPQIIPLKLAFWRLVHLCAPCTDHPCSNSSEIIQEAHFSASSQSVQADLGISCSAKNGDCFKFCSWAPVKIALLRISCIATPQQRTWTFVKYLFIGCVTLNYRVLSGRVCHACRLRKQSMLGPRQLATNHMFTNNRFQ
jgi:hypothetical protein